MHLLPNTYDGYIVMNDGDDDDMFVVVVGKIGGGSAMSRRAGRSVRTNCMHAHAGSCAMDLNKLDSYRMILRVDVRDDDVEGRLIRPFKK